MPTPEGLLTAIEAAALANRTVSTISLWARRGHLPSVRTRVNYRWMYLFRPEDVARVSAARNQTCKERNYRSATTNGEETMEDLDRMVAEQMANLPWWFHKHRERMKTVPVRDLLKGEEDDFDE